MSLLSEQPENTMHRILLTTVLYSALTVQALANEPLKGFAYASAPASNGNEWESPEQLALNKEQPHAYFFSFSNLESARKVNIGNLWMEIGSFIGLLLLKCVRKSFISPNLMSVPGI